MNFFRVPNMLFLAAIMTWSYLGLLPWREQQQIEAIEADGINLDINRLPFGVEVSRVYVNKKLLENNSDMDLLESLVKKNIIDRPFFAHSWLDLAHIKYHQKNLDEAIEYADKAQQLWSTEGYLLYFVGSFWMKIGEFDRAIKTFGKYLSTKPRNISGILDILFLLESDSDKLVRLLFADESIESNNREQLLRRVLSNSIHENRIKLAISLWNQFNPDEFSNDKLSMKYLNALIRHNYIDQAILAWNQYTDDLPVENVIVNGGFESEFINGGFDWRIRSQDGVEWSLDSDISYQGQNSLKLNFDGQDNINYSNIQQVIPVEPGAKYRLTAYWRGTNVTTRSTPFIQLAAIRGQEKVNSRSDSKRGSWSWEKLAVEIKMPEDSKLLRVSIRRKKTNALDRNISGTIWFDEFNLEKL